MLFLGGGGTEECFNVAMVLTKIVQYSIIVYAVPYGVLLISPLAYTVRTYDLTGMQP
jgi:hypothetical protein